jgi:protein gp37
MAKSKIEWCDYTFNPWIGCHKIAPGCLNCYAETLNGRMKWCIWGETYYRTSEANWNKVRTWDRKAVKMGTRFWVFCASLADVFEEDPPQEWRDDLWNLIRTYRNLDWLLLTKRPWNIKNMVPNDFKEDPWDWVWMGVSIDVPDTALGKIDWLIDAPAAHRFVSAEPLLDEINLLDRHMAAGGIDWLIVGGESGKNARPMQPTWALTLALQAHEHNVPFFMKQMGTWWMQATAGEKGKGNDFENFPGYLRVRQFPD